MGNWLRDHFYQFVYPAICLAKQCMDKSNSNYNYGYGYQEYSADPKDVSDFFPVRIPIEEYESCKWWNTFPPELRKLRALCDQLNIGWSTLTYNRRDRGNLHFDVLRETLLAAERKRQVMGCDRLFLAGRDVWALEVMARKRDIKTLFLPEISRNVVNHHDREAVKVFLTKAGFTGKELLVDTGFMGSIPLAINEIIGCKLEFLLMSQRDRNFPNLQNESLEVIGRKPENDQDRNCFRRPNQLFPQRKKARNEALETEYLPKYFRSGLILDGKVKQFLSEPQEIVLAAILTSDIWRGVKFGRNAKGKISKGGTYNGMRTVNSFGSL